MISKNKRDDRLQEQPKRYSTILHPKNFLPQFHHLEMHHEQTASHKETGSSS